MEIDTLILSGCSTKLSAYIGSLHILLNNNIININNITTIISTSAGSLISILLALDYKVDFMKLLVNNIDYHKILNWNDLNNLL